MYKVVDDVYITIARYIRNDGNNAYGIQCDVYGRLRKGGE